VAAWWDESNEEFAIGECPVSESTHGADLGSQISCSSLDLAMVVGIHDGPQGNKVDGLFELR